MSALPPKADMCSAVADVRFGPKADISAQLFILNFMVAVAAVAGKERLRLRLGPFIAAIMHRHFDAAIEPCDGWCPVW